MGWLSCFFPKKRRRNELRLQPILLANNFQRRTTIPKRKKESEDILTFLQHPIRGNPTVSIPVNIYEPLSVLQRLAEPFEYSHFLDMAAATDNYAEQIKYIAAFSHVIATKIRERKSRPFDSLLGETYELDRSLDMGYRFLSELVCLDPPVATAHCIGAGWICRFSFGYSFNVTPKCLNFLPNIHTTVTLNSGSVFTWPTKLSYKIYNIIFGKAYFDTFGTVEIVEHKLQEKYACKLEYLSNWPEKHDNSNDIIGTITKDNVTIINICGDWDKGLEAHDRYKSSESKNWIKLLDYTPVSLDKGDNYRFTKFAIQLNELEKYIAPTDSRLRADIRDLENGKIKSGNANKKRLRTDRNEIQPENNKSEHQLSQYEPSLLSNPRLYSMIDVLNSLPVQDKQLFVPSELHEPLTMLQKLTEMFEFSTLLDLAATQTEVQHQMTYLAAFSNVTYSTINERTTKPFTPILGETYEYDRSMDLGWKCISEQVQYIPPVSVLYCEGRGWICTQEFSYDVVVGRNSISVLPKGSIKLRFPETNCEYTWKRNNIKLYNYVMGKLVAEIQGNTRIIGAKNATGYKCSLQYNRKCKITDEFIPDMEGTIVNKGEPLIAIRASWRDGFKASSIKTVRDPLLNSAYMAADFDLIYRKTPIPPSREIFYNFSEFACSLNQEDSKVAFTDSRYRHDVRFLEKGIIDGSNESKRSLEDKQYRRITNNWNKPKGEIYSPAWFSQDQNNEWVYNGEYWYCKEIQDWSRCPEIF